MLCTTNYYACIQKTEGRINVASFLGSSSFHTIIQQLTFDLHAEKRIAEGEPGPKHHVNDVKT